MHFSEIQQNLKTIDSLFQRRNLSDTQRSRLILLREELLSVQARLPSVKNENKETMVFLQEVFDTEEEKLKQAFDDILNNDILPSIERAEKKIDSYDIAAILALVFLYKSKLEKPIQETQQTAYEKGKTSAMKELKALGIDIDFPPTPAIDITTNAFERTMVAETIANDINNQNKETILKSMQKGVAAAAIISALTIQTQKEYKKRVDNFTTIVVGNNINRGRWTVFTKSKIVGFRRTEVLDNRTCSMCVSLHNRVVRADDPMAQLESVHSRCRGIWVPITETEELENAGLPKSITDNFDLVGGAPMSNAFTQLKKPIKK